MAKVAVVYWTGTGNTEQMAEQVAQGARDKGAEVELCTVSEFSADACDALDAIALGCPAMGDEVLEEGEFQPLYDELRSHLKDKSVGLFGSYGWGDGQWMLDWEEDVQGAGANLVQDPVICQEAPDDDALAACKALGEALA